METVQLDMSSSDRVLILGSSGWFGSTAMDIALRHGATVMGASSSKTTIFESGTTRTAPHGFDAMLRFRPTIVIDCAFVTRQRIADYGAEEFQRVNGALIERALILQGESSVRRFLGVSSGAAVPYLTDPGLDRDLDLYGFLKAQYEHSLFAPTGGLRENVVLLRPWSMSGRHCKSPRFFALYDMIEQSRGKRIEIRSESFTYRRYTDVEDMISVGLMMPTGGAVIESGGELVEMADLAEIIVDVLGSKAVVDRTHPPFGVSSYHSDNSSWDSSTRAVGLSAKSLRDQILVSASFGQFR